MGVSVQGRGMVDRMVVARIVALAVVEGALLGWWFVLRPQPAALESMLPMWAFYAALVAAAVVIVAALVLLVARRLEGSRQGFVRSAYVAGGLAGLLVAYSLQPVGGPV